MDSNKQHYDYAEKNYHDPDNFNTQNCELLE